MEDFKNQSSLESTESLVLDNKENQTEYFDDENKVSSGDLFFEKFNNTKKSKKNLELEKAKKSIQARNKQLSFDKKLENNVFLVKLYSIVGVIVLFILGISITVFVINIRFYDGVIDNSNAWYGVSWYISKNIELNRCLVIMEAIAYTIVVMPFLFIVISWFVGMNQIMRSWKFTIVLFIFIIISALIVLITIPIFSIIYSYHSLLPIS